MAGDRSQPLRRSIIAALNEHGPMTGKALASLLEAHYPTVANLCSLMVSDGDLIENVDAGRRGRKYVARGPMLLSDRRTLSDLLDAYGTKAVFKACAAEAKVLVDA